MGSLKVFLTGTKKGSNESVINFEEFNSEFENSDVAFIALMAPWCGHCNNLLDNLKPVVDKLKYEKTDKKVVVGAFHGNPRSPDEGEDEFPKLHNNIDTNVLGFPTIRLYKNGVFEKNLGDVLDRSEEGLEKCIRDLMGLGVKTPSEKTPSEIILPKRKRRYRRSGERKSCRLKGRFVSCKKKKVKRKSKSKRKSKKKIKKCKTENKRKSKRKSKRRIKRKSKRKKLATRLKELLNF